MSTEATCVSLPVEADWFRKSLAEAIVWCTRVPLETGSQEDQETRDRRELGRKAGELNQRAHLSRWPEFVKSFQYRRANRMFASARLHEIAPLRDQLRSPAFRPPPFLPDSTSKKCGEIVGSVVARRAESLQLEGRTPSTRTLDLIQGKLLLFAPEESLSDGAACYSSKGFFDVDNCPAWDTWVGFVERYVVSWVPPQLIELAKAGIDVNPEQCIIWA